MPEVSPRYPCPVCLGSRLEKTHVGDAHELELDHCPRCGGIWFELGEVQRLRRHPSHALWARVSEQTPSSRTLCHSCHAPIDRNAASCSACGARNIIDCPVCQQPLEPQTYQNLRLDVCRTCRGVWFDHVELAAIWKLSLDRTLTRRGDAGLSANTDVPSLLVLDTLWYMPDVVFLGARSAGYAISGAADVVANSGVVDAVGDAAGGVFEAILDILSGIF